ncbi:MAG: hypothetical protein ABNH02_06080 [Pseudomonadales bacterium]|jgi:hypothetical protein
MKHNKIFLAVSLSTVLAACGSDVDLNVGNTVNGGDSGGDNGGGGVTNPCSAYSLNGTTYQGDYLSDGNCSYSLEFARAGKPVMADVTFSALESGGVHKFAGALEMGQDVDNSIAGTVLSAGNAPVDQGGAPEGPVLFVNKGATLAFPEGSFLRINRGSQIIARGAVDAPITFTSIADIEDSNNSETARQQWGGLQLNGNGITQACTDDQRTNATCAVQTEGVPSYYGGNNNDESSGAINYVVVKHSGFEVSEGDELNGISFYAVGGNTEVDYVQVYSTYDDGLEFFGGDVSVSHAVLSYVDDDSLDFTDGHTGVVQYALIVHEETDGNRCIEADGQSKASGSGNQEEMWHSLTPYTDVKIANMTCLTSASDESAGGTHGDSEGVLFRKGFNGGLYNSIVTTFNATGESNELVEFDDGAPYQASQGRIELKGNIFAGSEPLKDPGTQDIDGNTIADMATFVSGNDNAVTMDLAEIQSIRSGYVSATETLGASPVTLTAIDTRFDDSGFIGAVKDGDDWTAGWTVGLDSLPAGVSN